MEVVIESADFEDERRAVLRSHGHEVSFAVAAGRAVGATGSVWRLPFRWAAAPATMTMPATCGEVDVAGAVGRVQECPSLPVARRVLSQAVVKTDLLTLTAHFRDACPGKRYLDCDLDDPAGQSVGAVRPIRDDIVRRVRTLLSEILDY